MPRFRDDECSPGDVALRLLSRVSHCSFGSGTFLPDLFCLVATWLGLAPFCTAALVDQEIEADLGLDGSNESVLYAAGVGVKQTTTASPD